MINKNDKQVELRFGIGDICINGGSIMENNKKIGIVVFSNQAPREIGTVGDKKAGQSYDLDEFPVTMTFAKPESIDVVIEQLEQAKKDME